MPCPGFYSTDVPEPGCRPHLLRFGGQVPACELKGFQQEMMCSGQAMGWEVGWQLERLLLQPSGERRSSLFHTQASLMDEKGI